MTVAEVLANSAAYDGKVVRARGFATFEFENTRLWRDEAAFRSYEPDQALLIDTKGVPQLARDGAKGRLAYVEGTVSLGWHAPRLEKVTSVQRDPTDLGPDRSWSTHPDFMSLLIVLSVLGFISIAFAVGSASSFFKLRAGWTPRKPTR